MASKVLFAALLSTALSAPAAPPAPYAAPAEVYPELPPVYNYQYGVSDPEYSGSVFSQQENRDNYDTNGEYRVNLPDGRVQIVTYTAGPEGYVADVKYEGVAAYPDAKPYVPAPAPAYKPAPVVKVVKPVVVAPAPYKPVVVAPAPYKPVIVAKPIVHAPVYHAAPAYHAAPVYHKPSGYVHSPINPAYTPKKYGFTLVGEEAPEAEVKEAPAAEEAAPAAPAPVEEAAPAPVVEEVAEVKEAPAAEEAAPAAPETPAYEAPAEETRYRYRFL